MHSEQLLGSIGILYLHIFHHPWNFHYKMMGLKATWPWTVSFCGLGSSHDHPGFSEGELYFHLPSLKLTVRPWKWMVGRWISFWEGSFSGAVLGRVPDIKLLWFQSQSHYGYPMDVQPTFRLVCFEISLFVLFCFEKKIWIYNVQHIVWVTDSRDNWVYPEQSTHGIYRVL